MSFFFFFHLFLNFFLKFCVNLLFFFVALILFLSSAPEAGCSCLDGRTARSPVGAACGFSLLHVWTGESRLRRQAGQTGPSAAPRRASVGCVLAGVSTALSSSLRPLCPPGTPPTQELCRWRLLQTARGLWGQPAGGSLTFPQHLLPTHPPGHRTGRRRSGSGHRSRYRRSPCHRPSYNIGRCPLRPNKIVASLTGPHRNIVFSILSA